jgi:hypothetical protein
MQAEVPPNDLGFPWCQPFERTVSMVHQILLEHALLSYPRLGISEAFSQGPFVFLRYRPIQ